MHNTGLDYIKYFDPVKKKIVHYFVEHEHDNVNIKFELLERIFLSIFI